MYKTGNSAVTPCALHVGLRISPLLQVQTFAAVHDSAACVKLSFAYKQG